MNETTLNVEGMTCGHCTGAVEKALSAIGIEATASVENKTVIFNNEKNISNSKIKSVIEEEGYTVK